MSFSIPICVVCVFMLFFGFKSAIRELRMIDMISSDGTYHVQSRNKWIRSIVYKYSVGLRYPQNC